MLATLAYPNSDHGPRLLTGAALAEVLCARRLRSYSGMELYLLNYWIIGNIHRMWLTLFPEEPMPATQDLLPLSAGFMHLVDDHLFPIEWDYADGLYDAVDGDVAYMMRLDIPFSSWGIELGEVAFEDQPAWAQPLLSTLLDPAGDWGYYAAAWWEERGLVYPEAGFSWFNNGDPVERLGALDPPFDGLATLYLCIAGGSGNPFLDTVEPYWRGMYAEYPGLYWNLEHVQYLATMYQAARPQIDKLQAYIDWFFRGEGTVIRESELAVASIMSQLEAA